jgi:hypothetical protein
MVNMPQIIAACITGFFVFVALMVQHILLSRKKRIEEVASALIPRRAELYRELMLKICSTDIQYKYEAENSNVKKIVFLHETCNRAIFELCPFASLNVVNAIAKLSEICNKYRPLVTDENNEEWEKFKSEFKQYLYPLAALMRSDCLIDPINKIIEDKITKEYVNTFYPKKEVLVKKDKRKKS